jgi:hypothetical protein
MKKAGGGTKHELKKNANRNPNTPILDMLWKKAHSSQDTVPFEATRSYSNLQLLDTRGGREGGRGERERETVPNRRLSQDRKFISLHLRLTSFESSLHATENKGRAVYFRISRNT